MRNLGLALVVGGLSLVPRAFGNTFTCSGEARGRTVTLMGAWDPAGAMAMGTVTIHLSTPKGGPSEPPTILQNFEITITSAETIFRTGAQDQIRVRVDDFARTPERSTFMSYDGERLNDARCTFTAGF